MNKIYIVTRVCDHEYGCTENIGVYPTEELAQQKIEKEGGNSTWTHWSGTTYNNYHIEEWNIEDE